MAALCHAQGRSAEAESILRENIRLSEQAEVREYFAIPHRINLANDLSFLAHIYTQEGRCGEAEALLQRALAMKEEGLGPEHVHVAWLLEQYGRFLRAADREAEADEVEARARVIVDRSGYQGCCRIDRQRSGSPPATT